MKLREIKLRTVTTLAGITLAGFFCVGCSGEVKDVMAGNVSGTAAEAEAEENPLTEADQLDIFLAGYTDQPLIDFTALQTPVEVRGIYVTANRAGGESYLPDLIDLCNQSAINAMVIDIKTDDGKITHKGIPIADEMGISERIIPDIEGLVARLTENDIYPIARIVCFKDNAAADTFPELYIKDENGAIWRDSSKLKSAWLNPYNKDSWDYILTYAKAAAEAGFKEIQFDYIRFDTSSRLKTADFGDTQDKTRKDIILEFTKYAMEELKPYGVMVSADVYGTVINSNVDADIVGQDYADMASVLDYICPMVYPSHYADGSMGIDHPDIYPYETIYRSMELSAKRLEAIPEGEHRAIVRPWLQDFTASWIKPHLVYGAAEREAQIKAVYDAGLAEWILWDASVRYDAEGMEPDMSGSNENSSEESDD